METNQITAVLMRETEIIFAGKPAKITPDAPLSSLGFDSMSFVELLIAIEKKFGVKLIEKGLTPADMQNLTSLARKVSQFL